MRVELELLDKQFADAAAAAFGKHGRTGVYVHAGGEVRPRCTVLVESHVAAAHADDFAVLDERGSRGEAREHFYAQGFGLLREPGAQTAERNDEIAVIVHLRRGRQLDAPGLG